MWFFCTRANVSSTVRRTSLFSATLLLILSYYLGPFLHNFYFAMPLKAAHRINVDWMNSRFESILDSSQETELQCEINTWGPLLTSSFLQRCALVTSCELEYPEYHEDYNLEPQLDLLWSNDGISFQDLEKLVLDLNHSSVFGSLNDRRIIPAIFSAIDRYTEKHLV